MDREAPQSGRFRLPPLDLGPLWRITALAEYLRARQPERFMTPDGAATG